MMAPMALIDEAIGDAACPQSALAANDFVEEFS
jgi:hypothetical protein